MSAHLLGSIVFAGTSPLWKAPGKALWGEAPLSRNATDAKRRRRRRKHNAPPVMPRCRRATARRTWTHLERVKKERRAAESGATSETRHQSMFSHATPIIRSIRRRTRVRVCVRAIVEKTTARSFSRSTCAQSRYSSSTDLPEEPADASTRGTLLLSLSSRLPLKKIIESFPLKITFRAPRPKKILSSLEVHRHLKEYYEAWKTGERSPSPKREREREE